MKALATGEHAEVSLLGIALALGSIVIMPWLGIAKQRLAEQLGSPATKGEGCCVVSPFPAESLDAGDDCCEKC